jgi:pimeloyl-ACP methyl ester carboxylesterase
MISTVVVFICVCIVLYYTALISMLFIFEGLTRVHVVGHSLGGKVAAVAALYLAEEHRLKKARGVDAAAGEGSERAIELMSLTLIDVSPVDYAGDDAFAEVFSTLDIVEQLNVQLPLIGAEPSTKESAGSSSSGGGEKEGAADRASPYARNVLSSMLGEKVEDPMLKAFLLASIQPVDKNRAGGVAGDGDWEDDRGGLSVSIREIMSKIESSKNFLQLHRPEQAAAGGSSGDSNSDGRALHASTEQERGSPGGFEWKFSVEGITDFRERLGGWPGKYTANQADPSGFGEQKEGEKEEGCVVTPYTDPVLVMKGALSKFVKSSHISPIAGLFPLFTLLTVRDAGHWLHFEKPKESSEALIKFIRKVEDRHREINKP